MPANPWYETSTGLTAWQIVLQSWLCHPDWTPEVHRHYLIEEEGIAAEVVALFPIARWLAEHAEHADDLRKEAAR